MPPIWDIRLLWIINEGAGHPDNDPSFVTWVLCLEVGGITSGLLGSYYDFGLY